jgi:hypothetical protein
MFELHNYAPEVFDRNQLCCESSLRIGSVGAPNRQRYAQIFTMKEVQKHRLH